MRSLYRLGAAALEVPSDALDGPLKHGADLGGFICPSPPAELAALSIPSAIEDHRVQMGIEPHRIEKAMKKKRTHPHIGTHFEDFLGADGRLDEATTLPVKRDPSVTLPTMTRAASALGKSLTLKLAA